MKNLFRYAARGVALAALGLVIPFTSHAFLITAETIGEKFTVEFLLAAGDTDPNKNLNPEDKQNLSAQVIFTHLAWDEFELSLEIDVTNLSESLGNEVGLYELLFGLDPNAVSVDFSHESGVEKFKSATIITKKNEGANFKFLGIDLGDTLSSTDPGYPSTLQEGQNQVFSLNFTFSESIEDGVEISPFGVFFQTKYGSYQFGGEDTTIPVGPPPTPIPEPATLGLLGLGMLAMGALRRRKVALKR